MSNIPWSVYKSFTTEPDKTGSDCCQIKDREGTTIGFIADRDNAEMIVRAMNEYSELLETIDKVKAELEDIKLVVDSLA